MYILHIENSNYARTHTFMNNVHSKNDKIYIIINLFNYDKYVDNNIAS